jgi:methyl-accepting chemotaxis protein WspA
MDWMDRFLIKFSYTSKVRFVLFIGNLSIIILLCMSLFLLYNPIEQIRKQKIGLNFLYQLNKIYKDVVVYLLKDSESSNDQNQINTNLEKFVNGTNILLNQKISTQKEWDIEEIITKVDLFQEYWKQIQNNQFKGVKLNLPPMMEDWLLSYQALVYQIAKMSSLTFDFDKSTSFLIAAFTIDLPQTQNAILHLLQMQSNFKNKEDVFSRAEFTLTKNNLINHHLQLVRNVNTAFELMSSANSELNSQVELKNYTDSLFKFFNLLKMPFASTSIEISELWVHGSSALDFSFQLNDHLNNLIEEALTLQATSLYSILWKVLCILVFVGIAAAILWAAHILRHPLDKLVHGAEELAKGNLAVRMKITTNDEIALITAAFNTMAEHCEQILGKATATINKALSLINNLSSHMLALESNMNSQERAIKQIEIYANNIQKEVEELSHLLHIANQVSSVTSSIIATGRDDLHKMESIIHEMLATSSNVISTLSPFQEKLVDINQVIYAIVKIADQSNLLSLNTAIRATQSGIEGRGFFVIADKIREMADQIAFATLDIEKAVINIINEVKNTVNEVNKFSTQIRMQVDETTEISNQLKLYIDATQTQVRNFEVMNQGIREQNHTILNINHAVKNLRATIQDSAFFTRKLYLEIEYLSDAAETLQEKTKKFKLKT